MSSYIESLLIEFGFRTRLARTPQPRPEAEVSPNGQTHPPSNNNGCPTSLDIGKDRGVLERSSGDAGSLPEPPFFATLPKEMDGRIPGPEGTRPGPRHGAPIDNQTIPVTNSNANGPNVQADGSSLLSNPESQQQARQDETLGQQEQLLGADSGLRADGIGILPGVMSNIDEVGHMSLPEDDGMGWLRKKIHAIRDLDLSNNEKARMIHELMTESYNSTRILPPVSPSMLAPMLSPPSINHSASPPSLNVRQLSDSTPTSTTFPASIPQYETQFSLTSDDLQPTYVPKVEPESPVAEVGDAADEDPDTEECDEAILGCQHYHRNVKLECHTCKKWYTCRFCHDAVEDHPLIRRDTEHMLCMMCGHAQPAAWNCRHCDEQTAQYYCDICKLWDNDSKKSIYHCYDCGICRIGQGLGKDFFHCKTCSVCLPISIEDTHRCIERSTQCDCPICGDYMFTSPETVVVMRCGHSLHSKCLSEYSKTSFRCPICSKTITNMESTFRNLDRTIESQPMPAEFKDTKGLIYCNDCGAKSVVKYHWLGLKCDLCESYNTAQLRVLQGGDISEVLEEEGVGEIASRPRSLSLNPDGEPATSLAALHLNTHTDSHRLSTPISAGNGQDRRFVSYNMTHGRAISPIVSNYFGLPTERESDKPSSLPFFGGAFRTEGEAEYGALNFLSKKLRDRYGFLAGDATAEAASAVHEDEDDDEDEDDGESSDSSDTDEEDKNEEDDDEDDGEEYIDLFGHR